MNMFAQFSNLMELFVVRSIVLWIIAPPPFDGALRVPKGAQTRLGSHSMSPHLLLRLHSHESILPQLLFHRRWTQVFSRFSLGLNCFSTFAVGL